MAFVSQRKRKGCSSEPALRVKISKSGACSGFLSKATELRSLAIDLQIDDESKMLRISASAEGFKVQKYGTFSCSRRVFEKISKDKKPVTIPLTLGGDGWWYGSYDAQEEAKHG